MIRCGGARFRPCPTTRLTAISAIHPSYSLVGKLSELTSSSLAVFQVGTVRSVTGGETNAADVTVEMKDFFDPKTGVIRSVTGQLAWHYRDEFATMDSPKAQGVTGFLSRNQNGIYNLSDVTIESSNDYATVNVVSLDDQPLADSERILVQVVTVKTD